MAQRYFNWTLAIVLLVGVVVLAAAALSLHSWQRSTRAEEALPLGEEAFEQQDWEEAARQIGRYLSINGDDADRLLKYGQAQLNMRPCASSNVQHAIAAYSSVLRLDSSHAEAARRLIEIYLGVSPAAIAWGRSPGEAELKARQFLDNNDDPTVRRFLGLALAQQRDFQAAQQVLTSLIADHPDHVPAYEIMGMLAAERPGDVNKPANYWFEEAVSRNPESAWAHVSRGVFFRQSGDRPNAMADFERAAGLDLSDTQVHLRLIGELIQARAYDQARDQVAALRARTPADRSLWRYWAILAIQSGSQQEMQTVAEEGLKEMAAYPWDFMPWAGELFIRAKRFDKAADCILQMRKKDIDPGRNAFLEGYLAQEKGQLQEATAFWRKAIALGYQSRRDPTWRGHFPPVRMFLASALRQRGDLPSAIEQLRLLVSDMPDFPQFNLALAQLLAQNEDWSGVLEQVRQVQRIVPEQTDAALLEVQARMRMLAGQGDSETVRQAWRDIETRLARLAEAGADVGQVKLLQIQAAMFQGKRDDAVTMLDRLQGSQADGLGAALLRVQLYLDKQDEARAISLLRQTIEKYPQSTEPVRHLALLLNRGNDRQECEAVIKRAFSKMDNAGQRTLGMLLAELYTSWGQDEQLYEWLTDVVQRFPDDIASKRRLLMLDRVLSDPAKAQSIVDQIKSIEGEGGSQWRIEQARVWILSKEFQTRYGEVVRLLQENLLASPEDRSSRLLLAAAYEKAGELQPALATYREALQRWPNDVTIVTRTVQALYRAGEDEEAQQVLDRAKSRDLYDPDIQKLQLAGYLRRSDMTADSSVRREALASASQILQDLVRQDPNDTQAALRLVSTLTAQNKYDEAQAALDTARARDPEAISVMVAQIELDIARGDAEAALRRCNEAVAREDNVFARMLRGMTYTAFRRYDEARADFDRMVALEPGKAEVWVTRSDFFRQVGRVGEAVSDIEKALELDPEGLALQRKALDLFLSSGDATLFQRAGVLVEQALQLHPQDVVLKLHQAKVLQRRETAPATEQARAVLREITEERPRLVEAWELLATLELREDQLARAMDVTLRGLAENPDSRRLLVLKAQAELRRSPTLAIPTLKGLIDQDPNDMDVISQLAFVYLQAERPQEALTLLRRHLTAPSGPARRQARIAMASVLYQTGDVNEAAAIFEDMVQAEPDDPSLPVIWAGQLAAGQHWTELKSVLADWSARHPDDMAVSRTVARDLLAGGMPEGVRIAEELLRSDVERHPQSIGSLYLLAQAATVAERAEEAISLNQRIIELDPNNVFAVNNLAWLLCEEQGQCQKALELANRGLKLKPDYIDLIETRGVIHYRLGRLEEALRDLSRSIELYPVNAPALAVTHFHLARVYAQMGRRTDAIEHVERALTLHRRSDQSTDPGQRKSVLSGSDLADAQHLLDQLQKGLG